MVLLPAYPKFHSEKLLNGFSLSEPWFVVHQSQFLSSGVAGKGEWVVPVTVAVGSYDVQSSYLVRGKVSTVQLPGARPDASSVTDGDDVTAVNEGTNWVKLNVGQAGFYRVQYDDELAKRLRSAIANSSIEATDRFGTRTCVDSIT